ncbi:hypothetical protein Efla_002711 [Eimeria flavescens]
MLFDWSPPVWFVLHLVFNDSLPLFTSPLEAPPQRLPVTAAALAASANALKHDDGHEKVLGPSLVEYIAEEAALQQQAQADDDDALDKACAVPGADIDDSRPGLC